MCCHKHAVPLWPSPLSICTATRPGFSLYVSIFSPSVGVLRQWQTEEGGAEFKRQPRELDIFISRTFPHRRGKL